MSERLGPSAEQAAERVHAGELKPAELFDFYRERATADELGSYLWGADEAASDTPAEAPLGRGPPGGKGPFWGGGGAGAPPPRLLGGVQPPLPPPARAA